MSGKNAPPKLMPCEPLFKGVKATTKSKKTTAGGLGGLKKAKKPAAGSGGAAAKEEVSMIKFNTMGYLRHLKVMLQKQFSTNEAQK